MRAGQADADRAVVVDAVVSSSISPTPSTGIRGNSRQAGGGQCSYRFPFQAVVVFVLSINQDTAGVGQGQLSGAYTGSINDSAIEVEQ